MYAIKPRDKGAKPSRNPTPKMQITNKFERITAIISAEYLVLLFIVPNISLTAIVTVIYLYAGFS